MYVPRYPVYNFETDETAPTGGHHQSEEIMEKVDKWNKE